MGSTIAAGRSGLNGLRAAAVLVWLLILGAQVFHPGERYLLMTATIVSGVLAGQLLLHVKAITQVVPETDAELNQMHLNG